MRSSFAILTTFVLVIATAITVRPRVVIADEFDAILATRNNPVRGLAACKGTSNITLKKGLGLVQSEVCTDFQQLISGVQTGNQIGTDIQTLLTDLQDNFTLTPFCAASLMLVFAQEVIDGNIGAGSCPVDK